MDAWKEWVPIVVSLVSSVTALVAVVVSPLVSWRIARRQINASNVSSKRQVWIDELRRDVAQALAVISRIEELKRPDPTLSREEHLEVFDRRMEAELLGVELLMRIKLRLNPTEQAHIDLEKAFQRLSAAAPDPKPNEDRTKLQAVFAAARADVLATTQRILKEEWNRVRRGE